MTQPPTGVSGDVLAAIDLGWCLAELYDEVKSKGVDPPWPPASAPAMSAPAAAPQPAAPQPAVPAPDLESWVQLQADLPGLGQLPDRQRLGLLIDQVNVGAGKLRSLITGAGLSVPVNDDWPELAQQRHTPEGRYKLARSILKFHDALLVALTACDQQVGLAYGLGRALADLSLRPNPASENSFTGDFRPGGRVWEITGWLAELHGCLPPHVSGAVAGSIAQWQRWAGQPGWNGKPMAWDKHGKHVVEALKEQGKRWRQLLTGQASPLDELNPEDYVQAAGFLIGRIRRITQRLLIQYWPWVAGLTAVMVVAVLGSLTLLNSPAAKGVGVAVSVFGWLGITVQSMSAELRRVTANVEQSLWEAELDLACAWAITRLPPPDCDRTLGEARPPVLRIRRLRQLPRS